MSHLTKEKKKTANKDRQVSKLAHLEQTIDSQYSSTVHDLDLPGRYMTLICMICMICIICMICMMCMMCMMYMMFTICMICMICTICMICMICMI